MYLNDTTPLTSQSPQTSHPGLAKVLIAGLHLVPFQLLSPRRQDFPADLYGMLEFLSP